MWASSADARRQIALAKGADGRIVTRLMQLYGDKKTRFDLVYGVVANALSNTFGRALRAGLDSTAVTLAERNLTGAAVVHRILHVLAPPGGVFCQLHFAPPPPPPPDTAVWSHWHIQHPKQFRFHTCLLDVFNRSFWSQVSRIKQVTGASASRNTPSFTVAALKRQVHFQIRHANDRTLHFPNLCFAVNSCDCVCEGTTLTVGTSTDT
jgi:hypothetical protein